MLQCTIKSEHANPEIRDDKYVIRDIHDGMFGVRGLCGNVRVAFTFSTNMWYWDGGFYGYLGKPTIEESELG